VEEGFIAVDGAIPPRWEMASRRVQALDASPEDTDRIMGPPSERRLAASCSAPAQAPFITQTAHGRATTER
jgi:hypothetical protein